MEGGLTLHSSVTSFSRFLASVDLLKNGGRFTSKVPVPSDDKSSSDGKSSDDKSSDHKS
jgi:hypothetical protein